MYSIENKCVFLHTLMRYFHLFTNILLLISTKPCILFIHFAKDLILDELSYEKKVKVRKRNGAIGKNVITINLSFKFKSY